MAEAKKGAIAFYSVIALILGAITYVEFAIVEYEFAWLNTTSTLVLLFGLSIVKFALVVAIYMHLRDDDPLYTGFFSSGLVIALGTFIALSALFTVRSAANLRQNAQEAAYAETALVEEVGGGHGDYSFNVAELEQKDIIEATRVPSPKTQAYEFALPAAQPASFSFIGALGTAQAQEADTTEADPPAEAVAATDAPSENSEVVAQASDFDWAELGETTYSGNCIACHQATGQGIPAAFPPLAGHMPDLYNAEGGREYIISVVLYGLQGEIEVNGSTYNGIMTPWSQLSDEQIAATLNHELTSWDNEASLEDFTAIMPDEVAALRDQGLSSAEVLELRPELP